jgi:hypothetical protein
LQIFSFHQICFFSPSYGSIILFNGNRYCIFQNSFWQEVGWAWLIQKLGHIICNKIKWKDPENTVGFNFVFRFIQGKS